MEGLFERAARSTGAQYLDAERQLRRQMAERIVETEEAVAPGAKSPDPVTRLLAEVLLAARGIEGKDYDNLEQLFVNLPARLAKTPIGDPSPDIFESVVTRGYGNRPTRFLALRLVKEPGAPDWFPDGVLYYLKQHKDPATVAAILRFAIINPGRERRTRAREALQAIADPALPEKIEEAQRWAEKHKLPFPAELFGLGGAVRHP